MNVEVGDEAVLIAAMADELHAAVPFDEAREARLHIVAAAAFAVSRADLRGEHFFERLPFQDRVVAVDEKAHPFRHFVERRVQPAV